MTIPFVPAGQGLPPEVSFAYTVARGGHYLKRRGPFFEACVNVSENPQMPEETESFRLTGPKIPSSLYSQVLAFFEAVAVQRRSEALVLLTFEGGSWGAVVPEQSATGASVSYDVPKGARPVGSIHSHPGMAAFFSKTDVEDEKGFDGLHIVCADRGFTRSAVACVAVVSGRRIELDPEDVIEGLGEETTCPPEWLQMVRKDSARQSLFEFDPIDRQGDAREAHPLCSSCQFTNVCDIDPPGVGQSCHFFEPCGLGREGP